FGSVNLGVQDVANQQIDALTTDDIDFSVFDGGADVSVMIDAISSASVQSISVVSEPTPTTAYGSLTIRYIFTNANGILGPPNFQPLFQDIAIVQASGEFGGPINAGTGVPLDDVVVAVDRVDPGDADSVFVFINQGVDVNGLPIGFLITEIADIGATPTAVVTGDFNDDGAGDIAVATSDDDTVWLLFNDGSGTGTFAAPQALSLTAGDGPVGLAIFDYNEDGLPDLAVANANSNTVRAIVNNQSAPGSFSIAGSLTVDDPTDVCPIDCDNDRDLDLAVLSISNETISLINVEQGSFAFETSVATGPSPTSATTTDLNNDQFGDLLVTSAQGNTLQYFQNDPAGAFEVPFLVLIEDGTPLDVITGDFDNDGDPDVALVVETTVAADRVDVYETDTEEGAVVLRPPVEAGLLTEGSSLFTGDFNGDTVEDLAILDTTGVPGGGTSRGPTANTDVVIFIGSPPVPVEACDGDITPVGGDGDVDMDDIMTVILSFGPCPIDAACSADIVPPGGNGIVNIDDLLGVINAFGPCDG
ncbi:MAG: VCBS repeat-containing protein, partial [Phycisphaerales bacterium]|nr:VCBS repeat-containing protein [Phycisphaerales bacterium]